MFMLKVLSLKSALPEALNGTNVAYDFNRIRRKLPSKKGQEMSGSAVITNQGAGEFTIRGTPVRGKKFEIAVTWADGTKSVISRFQIPSIRMTVGTTQKNYDGSGKLTSTWTDNVVALFLEGNDNFGAVEPVVEEGECRPPK